IQEEANLPHTPVAAPRAIAIVEARHDHGPPARTREDRVELDAERIRMSLVGEQADLPGRPERQPAAIRDRSDAVRVRREAHPPRHDIESLTREPREARTPIRDRLVRPTPALVPVPR